MSSKKRASSISFEPVELFRVVVRVGLEHDEKTLDIALGLSERLSEKAVRTPAHDSQPFTHGRVRPGKERDVRRAVLFVERGGEARGGLLAGAARRAGEEQRD